VCNDPQQTGCFRSWCTFRKGYRSPYLHKETDTARFTNPLSWTTGPEFISRKQNKGALVRYNKLYRKSTDAQIKDGLLYTKKPRGKKPGGFYLCSGRKKKRGR